MNNEKRVDRFTKYLKIKKISVSKAERLANLWVSTIIYSSKDNRDLTDNSCDKILRFFTDLNPDWLLTGDGEMLLNTSPVQTVTGDGNHDNNMINSCSTAAIEKLIKKISHYWCRHTWATIAHALGHGKSTVTDIYIDFDLKKVDEANRKVIDYVFYNKK